MHNCGVAHGNLKLSSVMFMRRTLGKGIDVRLGGLTHAAVLEEGHIVASRETDMLNLGRILASMLLGRSDMSTDIETEERETWLQEIYDKISDNESLVDLVKGMLEDDQKVRLTASRALKHEYFS